MAAIALTAPPSPQTAPAYLVGARFRDGGPSYAMSYVVHQGILSGAVLFGSLAEVGTWHLHGPCLDRRDPLTSRAQGRGSLNMGAPPLDGPVPGWLGTWVVSEPRSGPPVLTPPWLLLAIGSLEPTLRLWARERRGLSSERAHSCESHTILAPPQARHRRSLRAPFSGRCFHFRSFHARRLVLQLSLPLKVAACSRSRRGTNDPSSRY